jgi:PAS domain S-box-containing protein
MSHSIDKILQILNEIKDYDDFKQEKNVLIEAVKNIEKDEVVLNFKHSKNLKDKNVLFSLLNKTSEDLKNANKELSKRAEQLNTLLNTIPALVFFKDLNFKYVMVNKAYCEFIEKKHIEIIGKGIDEVQFSHESSFDYSEIEKEVIVSGKHAYNIEEKIRKGEADYWLSTNLAPVKNEKGEIIGLIGVSWNITDQINSEIQLRKSVEIANEGTRVKNQFLANISHEIRTPLNGIIGMSQILTKTNLDQNQQEYLDILINSSDSLLSLVNDILDFSKIEAGKSELEFHDFNFKDLLNDIKNIIEVKAEEKGLCFEIVMHHSIPEWVNGDNYKLKQVILNLAKNAIKFTSKGCVKIHSTLVRTTKKHYQLEIKVSDTGIGIKDEKIAGLFDGFYQLDSTTTRNYGGTGLGLAISKRLLNMMGGEIKVNSIFGKGSDFSINFNLFVPKEKNLFTSLEYLSPESPLNVLLVEDNLVNQKITEFSIKQIGYNIDIANNGLEAIDKYRNNIYHFILMDLQMPIMNGFESTIEIRKIEDNHPDKIHIPIIALTANATKEDRKKSMDAGMDGFMSKPFNALEIKKLLVKLSVL